MAAAEQKKVDEIVEAWNEAARRMRSIQTRMVKRDRKWFTGSYDHLDALQRGLGAWPERRYGKVYLWPDPSAER